MSRFALLTEDDGFSAHDDGQHEVDAERLQAQKFMQMLDLGTGRREYVTTHDKPIPRELRISKEQLLRARKVEEEGTDAAIWYQANKTAVNAWNSISTEIANDNAGREQLADLMGGQSHRAKLNKEIKEQGGQNYGELSTAKIDDHARRGRGGGVAGRGVAGRSGRGAPMHIPVTRTVGKVSAAATLSIPTGPSSNRPLDPAIDPTREYAYKSRRGGKTFTMSYNGGPAVRVVPALARGKTPNDARATMEGSTVRISPATLSDANSESSKPPRAPRVEAVTMALNDQAFLRVMRETTTKPAFNSLVQGKSKPAPSSKAAALVEQPAKRLVLGAKKAASGLTKSSETPAEAFQKMEARASKGSSKADVGKIRLAPTHEFAFPLPITRSGRKNLDDSDVSVHTDGVESAATFVSADFETQSSSAGQSKSGPNHGTIIIGSNSTEKSPTTKSEAKLRVEKLGIRVLPPPGHVESNRKEDLIVLDEGSEPSQVVAKASDNEVLAASNAISVHSPSVPDIMDQDLDVDLPQFSLTPRSSVAPRSITYRGARYIRADTVTSQYLETHQQATRPGVEVASSGVGIFDRVAVTNGLNIGFGSLQESSANGILGEHSLPGRSRASTEASSTAALEASRWATGNFGAATFINRNHQPPMLQSRADPTAFQQPAQPSQYDYSFQSIERDDTGTNDASATSSALENVRRTSNLAASKWAAPTSNLSTLGSATFTKSGGPSFIGDVCKHTNVCSIASQSQQHKFTAPSQSPDSIRNMYSAFPSKAGSFQADRTSQEVDKSTKPAPNPSHKTPNLAASKWATPDRGVSVSAQSNKKSGDGTRQSRLRSDSAKGIDAIIDPVLEPQESGIRKRNPFGAVSPPSKPALFETINSFPSTIPSQPATAPRMTERSGNIPPARHTPLSIEEQMVRAERSGARAGQSAFKPFEPAGSKSTRPVDSSSANGPVGDPASGTRIPHNKPNPPSNLMASKYATNASSSFSKDASQPL